MEPEFELDGVTVTPADVGAAPPGGRAPSPPRPILDDVSLRVPAGERRTLLGRSGSGKSTLLRLLNRMIDPSRGTVRFRGRPVRELPPADLRRQVAMVFQEPVWLPGNARDNLLAPVRLGLVPAEAAEARLPEVLDRSGVDPAWLDRGEDGLSVGQRQRIVLGRALVSAPRALLLDEPTSALDPPAARAMIGELRSLAERDGLTVILVTHRLEDARQFGAVTVALEEGRVLAEGNTADVVERLGPAWRETES